MPQLIQPAQPFDFELAAQYWLRSPHEILARRVNGELRRMLADASGRPVLIGLRPAGAGGVELVCHTPTDSPASIEAQARRMLAADFDLRPYYAAVRSEPVLAWLGRLYHGLRIPLTPTLFESLAWAIIGQQITLAFAYRLKGRLVEAYGDSLEWQGSRYFAFPAPEKLAALEPEDLRPLSFSRSKATYLLGLAQAVTNGLNLEGLARLPDETLVAELTRLKGIGRWTAEYALMRGYGRVDSLPAADIGLRNAVTRFYGLGHQANEAEVRALGQQWAGWRSLATFYLWHGYAHGASA